MGYLDMWAAVGVAILQKSKLVSVVTATEKSGHNSAKRAKVSGGEAFKLASCSAARCCLY